MKSSSFVQKKDQEDQMEVHFGQVRLVQSLEIMVWLTVQPNTTSSILDPKLKINI